MISGEDLRSGQTVPDADVFVINRAQIYRIQRSIAPDTDARHWVSILRKHGKRYQTDADGYARIPPLTEEAVASVENEDLIGVEGDLKVSMEEFSVTVRPRKPLIARVVGPDGNPVEGVPVAIRSTYFSGLFTASTRRTDSSGKAKFFSISMLTQKVGGPHTFYARLEVPSNPVPNVKPLEIELTDEVFETGEISFTLSEVGGVSVSVFNHKGEPFLAAGHVSLCLKDWVRDSPSNHYVTEPVVNGVAKFPYVGMGATLKATFKPLGGHNEDEVSFEGPQQVGEWAEAALSTTDWPFVTGTLLDPNGEILADKAVYFRSQKTLASSSSVSAAEQLTGKDGRFRYEPYQPSDGRVMEARRGIWTVDLPGFGTCRATRDFPHPLQPGENDLGEITFAAAQALLAGKVLDGNGKPVAGATIEFKAIQKSKQNGLSFGRGNESSVDGESNRKGEFALIGELPDAPEYKVTITAPGYESLTQEVSPGTQGLEFILGQAGSLAGTLLLDEGMDHHRLSMTMSSPGVRNARIRLEPTNDPTKFLIHGEAEVGRTYRLEFRTWLREEILTLDSLSFLPGEELRPAELQPFDLRGKLNQIRITLQNAEGQQLEGSYSIIRENGSSGSSVDAGGTTLTTIMDQFEKIEVSAKGYKPKTLLNVRSDQVVTLERAISFAIQIPKEFVQYREMEIGYSLMQSGTRKRMHGGEFDSSGRSSFFLPSLGEFEITLHFMETTSSFRFHRPFETKELSFEYEGQVLEVSINQTALDAKIDEAEKEGD